MVLAVVDVLVVDVVLVDVLLVDVVLVVLDELVTGAVVPSPGPRLVSWITPQMTIASITPISPNQAISTERRRNHGVADGWPKAASSGDGGGSNGL